MITITRSQARRLRRVFRRTPLGIPPRGPVPPLVLTVADGQLLVRHRYAALAVEHASTLAGPGSGSVTLPLDALADLEGNDDSPVDLKVEAADQTVACWADRDIIQAREYAVATIDSPGAWPSPPDTWAEVPASFLDALAVATTIAAEDTARYALSCLLLKAAHEGHEVVATDSRQILIRGGFRLPWADDVLVRRSPIFACRELPHDRPWSVGRTDTHVVMRSGPWTLSLEIPTDVRYPRVDQIFPSPDAATTRLRIDPADATALSQALGKRPEAEANAPVTLDLNGRIAIRSQGPDQERATELVLSRSLYSGTPVRFASAGDHLAWALRLGFREIEVVDPSSPIVCRDDHRAFAWQPLDASSVICPSDDVIRIDLNPVPTSPTPSVAPRRKDRQVSRCSDPHGPAAEGRSETGSRSTPDTLAPAGMAALIAEARALHEALGAARARAGRLVRALRKQKRREQLVATTLASLRQLRLQDVPR